MAERPWQRDRGRETVAERPWHRDRWHRDRGMGDRGIETVA